MTQMSIKSFVEVAKLLPVEQSVMVRGNHGIGKSDVVRMLAHEMGFKKEDVIDQRLAQKTEGDIIGMPDRNGQTTRFLPLDWLISACEAPKLLFFDELNRATIEVMQSVFELALDRGLNGNKLHPGTRVYVAINADTQYTVNEIDPALLDRFWVVDLNPTVDDWITWARRTDEHGGDVSETTIEFVQCNTKFLDPEKNVEQDKVTVSRRSWKKLDNALKKAKLIDTPESDVFYHMCLGFIGVEATIAYQAFAKKTDNRITGEDIICAKDYEKLRKKFKKLGQEQHNICIERVTHYLLTMDTKVLSELQLENLYTFVKELPGELRVSQWAKIMQSGPKNIELARQIQKKCSDLIVEVHK